MRTSIKILVTVCILFLSMELLLRVAGFFYINSNFKETSINVPAKNNAFKIMFIGDSWTQGSDATPGNGFADKLITLLRKTNPEVEGYNLGKGSFNSSEVSFAFLKQYKQIRPSLLVILMGINNIWNSQDVEFIHVLMGHVFYSPSQYPAVLPQV